MLKNFKLAALVKTDGEYTVYSIPLTGSLQTEFSKVWLNMQLDFTKGKKEIEFDAGYSPEIDERFVIDNFTLPDWFDGLDSRNISKAPNLIKSPDKISDIKAIIGFGNDGQHEVMLFQNFGPSHVIKPKGSLVISGKSFESNKEMGLSLGDKITAYFTANNTRLVFFHYSATNVYLPLAEFFSEATEEKILEVLSHKNIHAVNAEKIAKSASQWFRKRFSMLEASGVLDVYTPKDIMKKSKGYDIKIILDKGKLVFPENKTEAKHLLQFLNEEIYKGAITDTLYETNSKREVD
jgi:hypothetical protein